MSHLLQFEIRGRIAKPVGEVFEAVADPAQLSQYFTTGGAQGRLEAGATVTWEFHDFPGPFPVKVLEVEAPKRIVLAWGSADDAPDGEPAAPHDTRVTFTFEAVDEGRTLVSIGEEGWRDTPKGLAASYGNCEGWTGMLCSMRIWLEYGIRFRQGFYR